MSTRQRKFSPREIAEMWGVSIDTVSRWIRSGELRATNVAAKRSGRATYVVDNSDLEAFEESRTALPSPKPRRRRKQLPAVTSFFD